MQMVYEDWGFEVLRRESELEAIYREEQDHLLAELEAASESGEPSEEDLVLGAPDCASSVCTLSPDLLCGLCGELIPVRTMVWWDVCEEGGATHTDCWRAELNFDSDPYRYFGVSRRDF